MKFLFAAILAFSLPALAPAALTIGVNPTSKIYYLSGSASGSPYYDEDMEFGQIFWDNYQPYDGGYISILSEAAFSVTGNTSQGNFILFLHGNGNLNGAFRLETENVLTLSGNQNVTYDYSGWSPALQAVLEGKAAANEFLAVTNGASASFGMNFAIVPEPSATLLLLAGGGGLAMMRRRFLRA